MSEPHPPFRAERHEIGAARDGAAVVLRPMSEAEGVRIGEVLAAIDPFNRLGHDAARISAFMNRRGDGAVRFALLSGEELAGAVVICNPWLAGPYLKTIGLLPALQGRGLGSLVLAWMEAEARRARAPNMWLCVSGFNGRAEALYARHGFERCAILDRIYGNEFDEVLMRKRLS
jgi:ribosomal protein S18 acetylase RimI-like enzyme